MQNKKLKIKDGALYDSTYTEVSRAVRSKETESENAVLKGVVRGNLGAVSLTGSLQEKNVLEIC